MSPENNLNLLEFFILALDYKNKLYKPLKEPIRIRNQVKLSFKKYLITF